MHLCLEKPIVILSHPNSTAVLEYPTNGRQHAAWCATSDELVAKSQAALTPPHEALRLCLT